MCFTSLSSAKPKAIISTSGGKSMKKSVRGSRKTDVNSFSKIALNPRKTLNKRHLLVPFGIRAGGQRDEDILQRGRYRSDIRFRNSGAGQLVANALLGNGILDQQVHRLTKDRRAQHTGLMP